MTCENVGNSTCDSFLGFSINVCVVFLQASDAAKEAEDNARKAKNAVKKALNTINLLLKQLGMYCMTFVTGSACNWILPHQLNWTDLIGNQV